MTKCFKDHIVNSKEPVGTALLGGVDLGQHCLPRCRSLKTYEHYGDNTTFKL